MLMLCCIIRVEGQVQQVTFGKGYVNGVHVSSSSNSSKSINTLLGNGYLPNAKAASVFLSQATLGATLPNIQTVQIQGIDAWLEQQLQMPNSFNLTSYVQGLHQYMVDSINATRPIPSYTIDSVFAGDILFDIAWFQGAMTSPDELRWRVGLALSEIFVTSRISAFDNNPYALASYYDILHKNALGNYRSLLDSITYSPVMGVYLTYMNNHATDTTDIKQVFPDENYAREVMQLFSIGLYELNQDGTEKKDSQGNPIPTYDNDDIANLAKVFTGLSWAESSYLGQRNKNDRSYIYPMKFFAVDSSDAYIRYWRSTHRIVNGHEYGPKTFLNSTIPARPIAQGKEDIKDALDILFNHPNVPPFMAIRLIQHLVKSNPSPAYIKRVADVFSNNGEGIRGDLKAVIKAILLDPEARDCCSDSYDKTTGHLREPFLRYMNLTKGLELGKNQGGVYRNVMRDVYNRLEQRPLSSPSVFNFYQPSYVPDGPLAAVGKVGPEFQMLNSLSAANYMNAMHQYLIQNNTVQYWGLFNNESYKPNQDPKFDLSADFDLARDERLNEFLDKYNLILAQGKVSPETVKTIKEAIKSQALRIDSATGAVNSSDADRRLRLGLFLLMVSPDYMINR